MSRHAICFDLCYDATTFCCAMMPSALMQKLVPLEPLGKDVPPTKRGHERCIALVLSATELFLKHGYDAVSLDDIVNHAGGSKASIYKYFGNKEGLFKAICDYRRELFQKDITLTTKSDDEPLDLYLKRILSNFIKHIHAPQNTAFIRMILNQAQKDPDLALYLHERGAQTIQKTIAEVLEREHEKGQIYCPESDISAMLFFGIIRDYEWRIILGVDLNLDAQQIDNHLQYAIERFLEGHQKR